jgi:choline dehydrogenase
MGDPRYDWGYRSAPDASRNGKPIFWSAGKVVGGGSAINGMVFNRGLARDYNGWAEAGCEGWSARDVQPYFEGIESLPGPAIAGRGRDGPQPVEINRFEFEGTAPILAACRECGIQEAEDLHGLPLEGAWRTLTSTRRGVRYSTREAFLRPAMKRGNLQLLDQAPVRRLLFDGRRCVGVLLRRDGIDVEARATCEVILTAGALATPKLLLLSGIGPASHLQSMGVDVLSDAAGVGANLQDHAGVLVSARARVNGITARDLRGWRFLWHGLRWLLAGRGPAAGGAVLASAYVRSRPELSQPDLQLQFTALGLQHDARNNTGLGESAAITTIVNVCQPRARGRLQLSSAEPDAPIDARLQLLGESEDLRRLLDGLRLVRRIHAAPALRPLIIDEQLPGADCESDAALSSYCREVAGTQFHPVGTCRMGGDAASVTDTALRVRGVAGLRVADASIMPTLTSGNTNAPVMMIAARAAALILKDRPP